MYGGNGHSLHHTYQGWQIEDIPVPQHHSDHHRQTAISEAVTIEDQLGQVIGFITSINESIPIISFTHLMLMKITSKHTQNTRNIVSDHNSLLSIMIEQKIIQTALTSIETFDGTKSKFETWTEAIENAAQISDQNVICKAFPKLIGSLPLTASRLKTRSQN